VSRREATVISQARGSSGRPSSGHCLAAAISASWVASSAVSKCPKRRTTAPRTCGASSGSRSPAPASGMAGQMSSSARESAIGRTSAKARARTLSGPGQLASRAVISVARSKLSHSTIQ
jgi:hypothetical protein